ncbi:MAG: hypothetical protein ACR2RE_02150, partial [Geminicoccaceae bacterium]
MNNSVERLWPAVENSRPRYSHHKPASPKAGGRIADLEAELDDVKQSFERANKRVNRLLGEKSQLSALLEKRDDQIDRLNRELGVQTSLQNAAEAKEGKRSTAFVSLVATCVSALKRTRAFFIQWSGKKEDPGADRQAATSGKSGGTHLVARHGGNAEHRIVGIVLFGLEKDEIERLLPIIERDCSSRGMKPLCLIDVDAFELLRGRRLIFEYLPPEKERDRFDASLNWILYLRRRLAIIRRKWDPVRVVAFG